MEKERKTDPRILIEQPNLSASWLFQRAMSAKQQTNVSSDFINELLCINFQCMQVRSLLSQTKKC